MRGKLAAERWGARSAWWWSSGGDLLLLLTKLQVSPFGSMVHDGLLAFLWQGELVSPVLVALGTRQELIATPLRSRFACLEDCASARKAAAGSTACWRILGSRPAFQSYSAPTELEGLQNCDGVKSRNVSALSAKSSVAGGGLVGWLC